MYIPSHFAEDRKEVLYGLIRAFPLGILVLGGSSGPEANHIPFVLQESGDGSVALLGHIARANRIWEGPSEGCQALAIFQGPSAYISPSWYPTKQDHGKVVPTWNYAAVHARGVLRFHQDASWIRHQMGILTQQMEAGRSKPWSVEDAPSDFIATLVSHVVGVELVVERLYGKWKVSQNQSVPNRAGVIEGLKGEGGTGAADMARWVAGWSPEQG